MTEIRVDAASYQKMVSELAKMREVMGRVAQQFRSYEKHHEAKGDYPKAEINAGFALLCEPFLEPSGPVGGDRPSFGSAFYCNVCNAFFASAHRHIDENGRHL